MRCREAWTVPALNICYLPDIELGWSSKYGLGLAASASTENLSEAQVPRPTLGLLRRKRGGRQSVSDSPLEAGAGSGLGPLR